MLIVDISDQRLSAEDKDLLTHPAISAVILFTRNYACPQQLKALTQSIRRINPRLLIMTDQEGGRVQRFQHAFTRLPSMQTWSQEYLRNPGMTIFNLDRLIGRMASELHAVGVDMPLMPVLDLDHGLSTVIGDRSLGPTPERVVDLATHILRSLKHYQMPSTGKHFPGHGAVTRDSHTHLPVDERPLSVILSTDAMPYHCLIHQLDTIMTAHIIYPAVDSLPASLSKRWLQEILRQRLRFKGVIISDCLSMQAVHHYGDYPTRAHMALEAGCDLIIVCNNRPAVHHILENIKSTYDPESAKRLQKLKKSVLIA